MYDIYIYIIYIYIYIAYYKLVPELKVPPPHRLAFLDHNSTLCLDRERVNPRDNPD